MIIILESSRARKSDLRTLTRSFGKGERDKLIGFFGVSDVQCG